MRTLDAVRFVGTPARKAVADFAYGFPARPIRQGTTDLVYDRAIQIFPIDAPAFIPTEADTVEISVTFKDLVLAGASWTVAQMVWTGAYWTFGSANSVNGAATAGGGFSLRIRAPSSIAGGTAVLTTGVMRAVAFFPGVLQAAYDAANKDISLVATTGVAELPELSASDGAYVRYPTSSSPNRTPDTLRGITLVSAADVAAPWA